MLRAVMDILFSIWNIAAHRRCRIARLDLDGLTVSVNT